MDTSKFARGGYVSGPATPVRMERIGVDLNGHCLYRFNDGKPEHVVTADEMRRGDLSQFECDGRMAQ